MGGHNNHPRLGLNVRLWLGGRERRAMKMGEGTVRQMKGQKIKKTKFVVVIGGRQSMIECNNQPNTRGSDGGSIEKDVRPSESAGGVIFDRSGGGRVGKGERIE